MQGNDRDVLSRAITLVESEHPNDRARAREVLAALLPHAPTAHRIGLSGVPGAGKSTLIDRLASQYLDAGKRVAVLAVDPSSERSGGSLLGDKTRMDSVARHPHGFVRPSPSRGARGGVSHRTHDAISLCEAAGFDFVIVETVGIGQSETEVAEMVDTFVLLTLAGGGDQLQAVKRGVLEAAEIIAVNKADGDNVEAAERARSIHAAGIGLLRPRSAQWSVPVGACSALESEGIAWLAEQIDRHRQTMVATGEWDRRRGQQRVRWMWRAVEHELVANLRSHPTVIARLQQLEADVRAALRSPGDGAAALLEAFAGSAGDEGETRELSE